MDTRKNRAEIIRSVSVALAACGLLLASVASAQSHVTAKVLHAFSQGSVYPSELIQAKNGAFYGTTQIGGTSGGGTAFKLTPGGALTTLHSFDCATEGCNPYAALNQASNRSLYGALNYGGRKGGGTLFQLVPPVQSTSY